MLCMSRGGAPGGGAVVLDVGRGREKVALVRLRLSKALLGAAETRSWDYAAGN